MNKTNTANMAANVVPLKGKKCSMCGKPEVEKFRPFCCKRCADLDLGKWLKEDYRVASDDEPDLDEDFPEDL